MKTEDDFACCPLRSSGGDGSVSTTQGQYRAWRWQTSTIFRRVRAERRWTPDSGNPAGERPRVETHIPCGTIIAGRRIPNP